MLRYREYEASRNHTSARIVERVARAFVFVVRPLVRLICRIAPSVDRALTRNDGGLVGRIGKLLGEGNYAAAFDAALAGIERNGPNASPGRFMPDVNWWIFLDQAMEASEHLGERERAKVVGLLKHPPAPGGMLAARCLRRAAIWRWNAGDHDEAIRVVREAVLADPTWPHSHVLLGWYGLITGRFDALPHLREALKADASCADAIRANAALAEAPGLLDSLGLTPRT